MELKKRPSKDFMRALSYDEIVDFNPKRFNTEHFIYWVFDFEKYFYHYRVRERDKVRIVTDRFGDYAYRWFSDVNYDRSCYGWSLINSWSMIKRAVINIFYSHDCDYIHRTLGELMNRYLNYYEKYTKRDILEKLDVLKKYDKYEHEFKKGIPMVCNQGERISTNKVDEMPVVEEIVIINYDSGTLVNYSIEEVPLEKEKGSVQEVVEESFVVEYCYTKRVYGRYEKNQ